MMVKVKICGITEVKDATWAARVGADALGFNFVAGTPRYIEPERARAIAMEVPPFVSRVGVFVNAKVPVIERTAEICDLDYVQLHGREAPDVCKELKHLNPIKVFRVEEAEDIEELPQYRVAAYLLDTYVKGLPGGTGKVFNWEIARKASRHGRIILAGGLCPENICDAVRKARPYAVDICSGVEEAPGKKSKELVEAVVRFAKSIDL
jgi:phosphoribosylanthranilate isomerase